MSLPIFEKTCVPYLWNEAGVFSTGAQAPEITTIFLKTTTGKCKNVWILILDNISACIKNIMLKVWPCIIHFSAFFYISQ